MKGLRDAAEILSFACPQSATVVVSIFGRVATKVDFRSGRIYILSSGLRQRIWFSNQVGKGQKMARHGVITWGKGIASTASVLLLASACYAAETNEKGIADFPKLSAERDWPWWRGPSRNGIAEKSQAVPTQWSDTENVVWRTPIPGRGHSSPTVVGDRVFLATADTTQKSQSVLAIDRRNGKPLWETKINQDGFPRAIHGNNTHASSTIASDGERLFITFYNHDSIQATALDLNGKKVWQKTVQPFNPRRYEYGYGPSPVIYRGSVIITAEYDGESSITALDRLTGKQLWRAPRTANITFSSPVVAHVGGRDQLLISGTDQIASYDPSNGKKLWSTPGTSAATCGTMVWDGGTVFASGGYPKAETIAIRGDGSGEVLWRNNQKCYEQSMMAYNGNVYGLTDGGVIYCWRATDGKEMWKQRLRGPVSSSPVLAGGYIYWANERGTTYVFKPNPEKFDLVAENQLGDGSFASPAVCGGQLFLRTATGTGPKRQEYLYCFGR